MFLLFLCFLNFLCFAISLNNGFALTPPMGWLSWERFKCNTNCKADPMNCISENLFITMADLLVKDGYQDAGYEYVNIDDCWMEKKRNEMGEMVADLERFPRGIKYLSSFMHSCGLKLGIYQDFGLFTCMGFPGMIGHIKADVHKFLEWGVDALKLDACHSHGYSLAHGYTTVGRYLRESKNRTVLYSCSWPYYEFIKGIQPDFEMISQHCNMYRFYHDIEDSWSSIEQIIDFFGDNQEVFNDFIHPGSWADPDMILIGNQQLTPGQSRVQMAVWAMIPAPLLMSNDLRKIDFVEKQILLNKKVIAVNQDTFGRPGRVVYKKNKLEIWKRSLSEAHTDEEDTDYALLFLNRHRFQVTIVEVNLNELGLKSKKGYTVTELFSNEHLGDMMLNHSLKFIIPPMDVVMLHLSILI